MGAQRKVIYLRKNTDGHQGDMVKKSFLRKISYVLKEEDKEVIPNVRTKGELRLAAPCIRRELSDGLSGCDVGKIEVLSIEGLV